MIYHLSGNILSFNFNMGHFFGGPQHSDNLTQLFNESPKLLDYLTLCEESKDFYQVPNSVVAVVIDLIDTATKRDVDILAVQEYLVKEVGRAFFPNEI